ncbi:MAG: hypothetical protein WC718_15860, partial [Phycisphaerales bacterium]
MRLSAFNQARVGVLGVVLCAGAALGQMSAGLPASRPASQPAGPADKSSEAATPTSPLAGPTVAEAPRRAGIVARDFDGKVILPEIPPEEAAFNALGLDSESATPEQKAAAAKVQEILTKRHRILDDFVVEHLALLVQLQTVKGTGNKLDQLGLFQEGYAALAPLREGGTLQEQIRKALPETDAATFDQYLADFWKAVEGDRGNMTNDDGTTPGRFGARVQTKLKSLGGEIKASYERVQYSGELIYRRLTEGLKLTPKQQGTLREVAADFM